MVSQNLYITFFQVLSSKFINDLSYLHVGAISVDGYSMILLCIKQLINQINYLYFCFYVILYVW